ncbi:MAG: hypothetical protein UZ18_ATM001002078 [Armatimonadetes bacterium OLB18]|nr:MAG: hypothetical protein UZ18_ATM001002078 [Armatimonadetes bacterium OLB18]
MQSLGRQFARKSRPGRKRKTFTARRVKVFLLPGGGFWRTIMSTTEPMTARDVERALTSTEFVAALRRLAEAIEQGIPFEIEVEGENVQAPIEAHFSIEHERSGADEELEFQLRWSLVATSEPQDEQETEEVADALS